MSSECSRACDMRIEGEEYPWVLLIHGSGRSADSYWQVPFYIRQREIARECGCAVAAVSMGQAVWAKQSAFDALMRAIERMAELGRSKHPALWATSAGGAQMFYLAQKYPSVPKLLIGTFPVWDIMACANSKSLNAEWAGDMRAANARNPAAYPPPAQKMLIMHGRQDITVRPEYHIHKLAALRPLDMYMTDDEHSTQAFGLYETPLLRERLIEYARGEMSNAT